MCMFIFEEKSLSLTTILYQLAQVDECLGQKEKLYIINYDVIGIIALLLAATCHSTKE